MISTLQAIFEGRRELFKGLWLDQSNYDWSVYPVIRIGMSKVVRDNAKLLEASLIKHLFQIAAEYRIALSELLSVGDCLSELISKLGQLKRKVVVLIDEYDKPLLDNIDKPEKAKPIRELLKDFYTILKAQNEHLHFIFLTGITKFSQISVFSGLNNLRAISMSQSYSTLLGYTQEELENNFVPWIDEMLESQQSSRKLLLKKIKHWYNGYQFAKLSAGVYNPFSTLLLFAEQDFKPHWFATGTPTFLLKLIESNQFESSGLDAYETGTKEFSSFDIEHLAVMPILYQAGYLTIQNYDEEDDLYILGYPNHEVKHGFLSHLLSYLSRSKDNLDSRYVRMMRHCIKDGDIDGMIQYFNEYLAKIPYAIHLKDTIKVFSILRYQRQGSLLKRKQ